MLPNTALLTDVAFATLRTTRQNANVLSQTERPMRDAEDLPCPACGFLTLESSYGSYVICEICGWEDDQVQLANPACGGGANSESLIEAQVVALGRYPVEVAIAKGVRRDTRWRPLNEVERELAVRDRVEKYWKNKGVVGAAECYWLAGPSEPTAR